jgi:hypothetical protein
MVMAVTIPEWLTRHGCTLGQGSDGRTWFVLLDGEPQYRLVPVPASGKFSCQVTQTINGRRLDRGGVHSSEEAALAGGLEDLRRALGW